MAITVHGLVFDNKAEAEGFAKRAKADLYNAGWRYEGRFWKKLELRKTGKRLHLEMRHWAEAIDWERKITKVEA